MASPDPLAGLGIDATPPPKSTSNKTVIGVPKGYVAPVGAGAYVPPPNADRGSGEYQTAGGFQAALTPYGTAPNTNQYVDGQEWAPLNDPTSIPKLQQELVQAGLLTAANVRLGVWDQSSAGAYKAALAFANATGANVNDALGILIQNQKFGTKSSAPGPFPVSNPEDDAAAFKTAAQSLVGENLSDAESQKFAAYFQSQERAVNAQRSADVTGGVTDAPTAPSVSTAAEDYIKQQDPTQVMAYGMASRASEFQQLLGSTTGL